MFEVSELKKHAVLAKDLKAKLEVILDSQNKMLSDLAQKIEVVEAKMQQSEKGEDINLCFAESEKLRAELVKKLILKSKLEQLLKRQEDRLKLIGTEIETDEESLSSVSKKEVEKLVQDSAAAEISIEKLGLNKKGETILGVDGLLFRLKNGELDVTNEQNLELLKTINQEKMDKIVAKFPSFVPKMGSKTLLFSSFRTKLLKSISSFVFEELKNTTIFEVNSKLGGLLCFDREVPNGFKNYMDAVENLFKVKIKNYILSINESQRDEFSKKLVCDEYSRFLPDELYKEPEGGKKDSAISDIDAEIDAFLASLTEK